ncbi:MAG: CtsR family transcriptional regulator [Christensenellales bacterium]|jgi:transcriptional regulator CtsR
MAGISDKIEAYLLNCLACDTGYSLVEISRTELARKFNCSPSQVNYVLTTRFTCEKGYRVESKRGGNGFIRIIHVKYMPWEHIPLAIKSIGDTIQVYDAVSLLEHLLRCGALEHSDVVLMRAAVNLHYCPSQEQANSIRAAILKNMLHSITTRGKTL